MKTRSSNIRAVAIVATFLVVLMTARQLTIIGIPQIAQGVGTEFLLAASALLTVIVGVVLIFLVPQGSSRLASEIVICVCCFTVAGLLFGVAEHFWRISVDDYDLRALLCWALAIMVLLMLGGYLKRRCLS